MVFREAFRSVASSFDHPQVNLLLILTRRRRSEVVRQRSAKPSSRVRFPPSPQKLRKCEFLSQGQGSKKTLVVRWLGSPRKFRNLGKGLRGEGLRVQRLVPIRVARTDGAEPDRAANSRSAAQDRALNATPKRPALR